MNTYLRLAVLISLTLPTAVWAVSFVGYTGKVWQEDFNVLSNRCDTVQVAPIAHSASPQSRLATATVDGAFKGVTHSNGDALADQIDAACLGLTLELVPSGQSVTWKNPQSGADIYVTPNAQSPQCRPFDGIVVRSGQKHRFASIACSNTPGVWSVKP